MYVSKFPEKLVISQATSDNLKDLREEIRRGLRRGYDEVA
tara:strand:- start:15571 stop:15690 length:120 start_codon:yes stop_codon:yes gene_type:complete